MSAWNYRVSVCTDIAALREFLTPPGEEFSPELVPWLGRLTDRIYSADRSASVSIVALTEEEVAECPPMIVRFESRAAAEAAFPAYDWPKLGKMLGVDF